MDLNYTKEEQAFREEVRRFVRANLPKDISEKVLYHKRLVKDDWVRWQKILYKQGWVAPNWPKQYGGCAWTPIQQHIFIKKPAPHVEDRDLIRDSIRKAVFAPALSAAQLEEIVGHAKIVRFGEGENIIRQDAEAAGPMYVIVTGSAEVWVESNGRCTSVAMLGPDDCIGEISVLTGEKRTATIHALEDCLAVEVDKGILAPIISASPELLETLSELLARRRMQNEGLVAEAAGTANQTTKSTYQAGFLGKLRLFFEV